MRRFPEGNAPKKELDVPLTPPAGSPVVKTDSESAGGDGPGRDRAGRECRADYGRAGDLRREMRTGGAQRLSSDPGEQVGRGRRSGGRG